MTDKRPNKGKTLRQIWIAGGIGITPFIAWLEALQSKPMHAAATLSKQIGMLKGQGKDASEVLAQVGAMGDELKASEVRLGELLEKFNAILSALPNVPDDSVPLGSDEAGNVEIKRWGTPRSFDFAIKDHTDVGETLGQLDFATAAKISGARFSLLKGARSSSERAVPAFPAPAARVLSECG